MCIIITVNTQYGNFKGGFNINMNQQKNLIPLGTCFECFEGLNSKKNIEKNLKYIVYSIFKQGFSIGYDIGLEDGILKDVDEDENKAKE